MLVGNDKLDFIPRSQPLQVRPVILPGHAAARAFQVQDAMHPGIHPVDGPEPLVSKQTS